MQQINALKQPPQFFLGIHATFVRAALRPDHAVPVEIRPVLSSWQAQHDDKPPIVQGDIFGMHAN
jgi:hypothetical protein